MWRVGSTGISHTRALCSHVADAAGLAVWEGEMMEGDKKRFESELEISRANRSQTGLKMCQTADEAEGREPVEAVSETGGDPVCQTSDGKGGETAGECRNHTESETESEVNTEKKREKTGWVLVCGQGFQLLRVPNTEMDETKAGRSKEKVNERVKVTLQEKST